MLRHFFAKSIQLRIEFSDEDLSQTLWKTIKTRTNSKKRKNGTEKLKLNRRIGGITDKAFKHHQTSQIDKYVVFTIGVLVNSIQPNIKLIVLTQGCTKSTRILGSKKQNHLT